MLDVNFYQGIVTCGFILYSISFVRNKQLRYINEVSICTNHWKYSTKSVVNDQLELFKNSNALNLVLYILFSYDKQKLQYDLYFKFCTNSFELLNQPPPLQG